jgi:4'-phosphopantetheinyl transferase
LPTRPAALAADELRLVWCPEQPAQGARRARVDRLLRSVLAPLLDLPPDQLRFGREEKGRPFLRHEGAPDFNLSDTAGGTLVALCAHGRIGADLERLDRQLPVARLAQRYFAPAEISALKALDQESARIGFLRLWTAKEASCKATGTGIFGWLPRWQFEVGGEQPRLLQAPAEAGDASRWQFFRVTPSPEHTAVLSLCDGGRVRITGYQLPDSGAQVSD